MAEVIDISSSSPVAATFAPLPNRPCSTMTLEPGNLNFDFGDNFFDDTGSIDIPIERSSAKRRKFSPVITSRVTATTIGRAVIHDLSSDPAEYDIPILRKANSISDNGRRPTVGGGDDQGEGMFFSSSAPVVQVGLEKSSSRQGERVNIDLSDSIETSSQAHVTTTTKWSTATAKLLAELEASKTSVHGIRRLPSESNIKAGKSPAPGTRSMRIVKKNVAIDDNIVDSSQPRHNGEADESHEATITTSTRKKSVKRTDAEKEAEKEAKRREKESKAAAKQLEKDILEVNKVKTNKNVAVREMMLDMPGNLKNKSLGNQVEEFMKEQEVPVSYYSDEVDMTELSEHGTPTRQGSVIRWRRKLTAHYDEETDEWKPLPRPKLTTEKHIILHLTADEFAMIVAISPASLFTADMDASSTPSLDRLKQNLDTYMTLLRSRYSSTTVILLIQGLSAWLKRNASAKNRAYTAAVRAHNAEQLESGSTCVSVPVSRRKPPGSKSPSLDLSWLSSEHIDLVTMHLQLHHTPIQIIHTTSPSTSAHQILLLTQHLATRPYRLAETARNLRHANFCTTTGQFRTGQGSPIETWLLMLEKLPRLTASMAQGIVTAGYESPAALLREFKTTEERDGRREAMGLLEDVKKAANRDGAWSDRRLGKELSKRLYKVFMGTDPSSMDGMS